MKSKWYTKSYIAMIMAFLYMPIMVLIVYSFNDSKSRSVWSGFSLKWYKALFADELILSSLANTMIIALVASVLATVLGTAAAMGIYAIKRKWFRSAIMNITYMPILNPEIVTGVSLLLLFVFMNEQLGLPIELGLVTLIIAHVTFCTPYVILNVLPKLRQLDKFAYEAAMDLGCSPTMAFFKVIIPEIMPGIITGFLMAVTYSIDDFIISYFVSSAGSQTLPVTIGAMVRKRISPKINALSAIIFVVVLSALLLVNYMGARKERRELKHRQSRGGGSVL
ncbi:MAG: ABC transporter permease [Angelakisella sp.]